MIFSTFWDELPNKKTESDIPFKNALTFDYLFETSSNNFRFVLGLRYIKIRQSVFANVICLIL